MSDVSIINGYDIKDATARADKVDKAGDTMTGVLYLANYPKIYAPTGEAPMLVYNSKDEENNYNQRGAIFCGVNSTNGNTTRFAFRQYSYDSSTYANNNHYDQYRLPQVAADQLTDDSYEIVTTKPTQLTSGSFGQAESNAYLKFTAPSSGTPFITALTMPAQSGSWSLSSYPGGNTAFWFTYNDGGGTNNSNTKRFYLSGIIGSMNESYEIMTSAHEASTTAAGIITTEAQTFMGTKGFGYLNLYGRNSAGTATQYPGEISYYTAAGTKVAESYYNIGNATNISDGYFVWREYSPKSTPDGSTTGYSEYFSLPHANVGRTANGSFQILTTKGGWTTAGTCTFGNGIIISNNTQYPVLRWKPTCATNNGDDAFGPTSIFSLCGSDTEVKSNRMYFRLHSPTASSGKTTYTAYYEQFMLPYVNVGRTENASYDIMTSKNHAWKVASVTFSSGYASSVTCSGVTSSSTILATRNTSQTAYQARYVSTVSYTSSNTVKMSLNSNTSATETVAIYWTK